MKRVSKVLNWWRLQLLTPEEKFLMGATDHCDLEHRMKKVWGYR